MSERDELVKSPGAKAEVAKAEVAKTEVVTVRVLRDYWTDEIGPDGDNKRIRAGTIEEVPTIRAIDMIEAGAAERMR